MCSKYVLVHGIIFLLVIDKTFSNQDNQYGGVLKDQRSEICTEKGFSHALKENKAKIDLRDIHRRCNVTKYDECRMTSPTLNQNVYIVMLEDLELRKYFMRVVIEDVIHTEMNETACWGIAFEATTSHSKDVVYYNKAKVVSNPLNFLNTHFDIYYMMGFTYDIKILLLPNGNFFNFTWKAPGRCEILILDEIHDKLKKMNEYRKCLDHLDVQVNLDFAKNVCQTHEKKDDFYNLLKDRVHVVNCTPTVLDIHPPSPIPLTKPDRKSYMLTVSLSIVASVILLLLILLVVFAKTKKLWSLHRLFMFGFGSKSSQEPLIGLDKESLTAMIIQKAGCEILEKFTQEFASFLQSYGIKVKMTSSNDHVIDAEGGIASYLQNNIKSCDVVFIMITNDEGGNKTKHKTYEFAIKMMEGFVLHDCAQTPYVPIYLTPYDQAVKHFPPFLKASTGYGYQLPENISRMMKKLFKMVDKSKDRRIKDNEFMKRLKEFSKGFLTASHTGCNKEYCNKGEQCTISDNLSSIWASTVYSKWPSQDSIDEPKSKRLDLGEIYELEQSASLDSIGHEKKQLCIDFIQRDSLKDSIKSTGESCSQERDTFSDNFSTELKNNRKNDDLNPEPETRISINDGENTKRASVETTSFDDDNVDSQSHLLA
ncbi:uncharacterized protein [Clytia hemisphaerica]|uniref:EF-hand domain-containing protein n=1 Tax=Clytia hemisphaerica TaxID=252671 RepID=A0A7M5X9X5_9CNID|eukprot:TCONS_00052449-protein